MPQLIGLVLVGAGVVAGYRAVSRLMQALSGERDRADDRRREARHEGAMQDLGTLEYDPASGVYKPRATREV